MIHNDKPAIVYWLDNSLYLNITNQCSNHCWFCFRNYKQGVGRFKLKLINEPQSKEVIAELETAFPMKHWSEVVFCGFGEPTSKLDVLLEVAQWIKMNFPAIPIRLDTNGHGYALNRNRDVAKELKAVGINKVSVSLNGHNQETYNENCKPGFTNAFEAVLEFVKSAKITGLNVEVSVVRMPEVDVQKVKEIVEELDVSFRVRDYIPCFW
jgi:TatD family-associated radical SAM protein